MAHSQLLSLPAELRNRIFEYLLATPSAVLIASSTDDPFCHPRLDAPWKKATPPSLARVNRQLRNEVTPMYYGNNTFEIHLHHNSWGHCDIVYATYGIAAWLRRMEAKHMAMLKKIVVCTLVFKEKLRRLPTNFRYNGALKLGLEYGERLEGYKGGLGHFSAAASVHCYLLDVAVSEQEGMVTGQKSRPASPLGPGSKFPEE
ncbi:hypothetical protein LTR27_004266 [Elasticomyces elasticus]|nr:hypothetical protein LTR27_004266 [Elasticomyces elasticus]